MKQGKYYINPETLTFEPVKKPLKQRLRNGLIYFVAFSFIAVGLRFFSDQYVTSPKVKYFSQKNQELKLAYNDLNEKIQFAESHLKDIEIRDDKIYRSVLDLEPIPMSVREAGYGGSESFKEDLSSRNTGFVTSTAQKLEQLKSKAKIQSASFSDIYELAREKEQLIKHIPSIRPISPSDHIWLTSTFGYRIDPFHKGRRMHHGVDLAGRKGIKIYASGDGVVKEAYYNRHGYGKEVTIDHGFGYVSRYAHLNKILVKPGQKIKRGQLIGELGSTGRSTGPHLHYEIRHFGHCVNPMYYYYEDIKPEEFEVIVQRASK